MKDPKLVYVIRYWIAPGALSPWSTWLAGYTEDVVSQPGFLWCRHLDLGEKDAKGWQAHAVLYGVDSRRSFDDYNANVERLARFAKERAQFASVLRVERFFGDVTRAIDR